jgi:intracellular septation protein A
MNSNYKQENNIRINSTDSLQQQNTSNNSPKFLEKYFSEKTCKYLRYFGFFFQHAILEVALPITLYFTLKRPLGELKATIISSVPTLLSAVYTILIKRRFEPLPFIVIVSFCIGLGLSLGFNDAKLNEIKVAIIVGAIGLAYLISLAFKRPLMYYFNRPWMTGNDPEKMKEYDAQWEKPSFAKQMRLFTMIWGIGFVLQAIANLVLIFTVSLDLVIVLGSVLTYGNIGLLAGITVAIAIWQYQKEKKLEGQTEQSTQAQV